MKRYRVKCKCLYWYDDIYEVEAESKEDIDDDLLVSEGECIESMIDALDQINSIDSIEEIEDDEDSDY